MKTKTLIITLFLLPLFSGCNKAPEPASAPSAEERAQSELEARRGKRMMDVAKAKRTIALQRETEHAKILLRKERHEIRPEEAAVLLAQVDKKAEVANLAIDAGGDPNAPFDLSPVVTPSPAPEFAPPGVFYLVTAARVETATGVIGLTPGTGVKLVRPGVYLTSAGEVALSDDQVTNNMTYARQVLAADQTAQAALRAASAAQAPPAENPTTTTAATVPATGFGKAEKLARIKQQLIILESQEANLRVQIGHEEAGTHSPRAIRTSDLPNQLRALEQQVRDLYTQKTLLESSP